MNIGTESRSGEPVDRRLAVYHDALLANGAEREGDPDPVIAGAKACLRLFERVRRQARRSEPDWLFNPGDDDFLKSDSRLELVQSFGAEADRTAEMPENIGRFRIERRLGEGGFGIVFQAVDPDLNRRVALKVPRPEALISDTWRSRFLREAEAAALLNHPHVVPVYEVGHAGSLCYIVQAFCDGVSLDRWLAEHGVPVAPTAAARLIRTLAEAVQHAHSRGVLHRDIKPSNILLGAAGGAGGDRAGQGKTRPARPDTIGLQQERTVDAVGGNDNDAMESTGGAAAPAMIAADALADIARLTDFGLARVIDEVGEQTRTGAVLGTPAYMAPEQAEGRPRDVGTACDIYSLGAVLYELLTGRPPFAEATLLGTLQAVREREPKPPRQRRPDLPADLEAVCLKCLEKDPQRRYATAADLANDLGRFLDGEVVSARRATRWQRTRRWCRRNPVPAALSAAVVLLAAVLLGASTTAALLLAEARQDTLDSLEEAIVARDQATQNEELALRAVYEARLAQSRAGRHSGLTGQRVEGLRALTAAAKHVARLKLSARDQLLLRNEALACMSLVDLVPDRQWPRMPPRDRRVATDSDVSQYAVPEEGWKAILVRRMDDNQLIARLAIPGGPAYVLRICFSPDSKYLAAWCRHPGGAFRIQVWALGGTAETDTSQSAPDAPSVRVTETDRQPVATLEAMTGTQSRPMDFSRDGRWLATALPGGGIGLMAVPGFEQQKKFASTSMVQSLRFDPAARLLAVARGDAVDLIEVGSGKVLRSLACGSFAFQLDFSPDGSLIAAACNDAQVRLWSVADGRLHGTLVGHGAQVTNVAFHPAGRLAATTSYDKTCRLWNVARCRQVLQAESDFTGFSRDGLWLGGGESRLRLKLPDELHILDVPQLPGSTSSVAQQLSVHPSGRLLAVSNVQQLVIFDLATRQPVLTQRMDGGYARFDSRGESLLTALQNGLYRFPVRWEETDRGIEVEIGSGQRLAAASAGYSAESAGGDTIAVVDRFDRPKIVVHNVRGNSTRTLQPHHSGARWLSVTPDGRLLATGTWHGLNVWVWDTASGEVRKTLPASNARVKFNPGGDKLVVDEGNQFAIWQVSDWKPLLPPTAKSFETVPGPIAFSADGRLLAILDSPRHVRLLDAATFEELASFRLTSERFIDSLIFDPQATRLIAGTTHPGTLHIWDLRQIREQLQTMDLDWDSDPDAGSVRVTERASPAQPPRPLRLRHQLEMLTPTSGPARTALLKQVEQYTRDIQGKPADAGGYWRRARTLVALSRFEEAAADGSRAAELAPGSNHGWFWRGRALQMQSLCAEAIVSFEKSLEILPKDAWCCRHLASLYTEGPPEVRDPQRALVLAEQALELARATTPDRLSRAMPALENTLASAEYRNGNWKQALDALDRAAAISDAPPPSTMLLRRALCLHQLGDSTEARRCYEEALDPPRGDPYEAQFNFDTLRQEAEALLGGD